MMNNIEQLTEQYLLGNLSPNEALSFEQYLSQNPAAQADVNMQQNIIEGIKQKRRTELKANLSKVNPMSVATTSLTSKIAMVAATLATATIVGISIYTFSVDNSVKEVQIAQSNPTEKISVPTTDKQETISSENLIVSEDTQEETLNNTSDETTLTPSKTIVTEKATSSESDLGINEANTSTADKTNPITTIDPTNLEEFDYNDEKPIIVDQSVETDINSNTNEKSTTSQLKVLKSKIQGYKYDGEEFILLGTYDKNHPYKIYAPRTYNPNISYTVFEYKGAFYKMIVTDKVEKWKNHKITID